MIRSFFVFIELRQNTENHAKYGMKNIFKFGVDNSGFKSYDSEAVAREQTSEQPKRTLITEQ